MLPFHFANGLPMSLVDPMHARQDWADEGDTKQCFHLQYEFRLISGHPASNRVGARSSALRNESITLIAGSPSLASVVSDGVHSTRQRVNAVNGHHHHGHSHDVPVQ